MTARRLGEFAASATVADAPEASARHAKYCVLDCLGLVLGGLRLEQGELVHALLADLGGTPEATVPGRAGRIPAIHAAYVNGNLSNMMDYEDTYVNRGGGHPGAVVVPAALALGEREDADGETVLAAILAGYEVALRVCDATAPSPERTREAGLPTATWHIFGAAAAGCRVLGADADAAMDAFGLAGNVAPIPTNIIDDGVLQTTKSNNGWASMGGAKAALLADAGARGNRAIFDDFWRSAGSDRFEPSLLTAGLGEEYLVDAVSFKPYPACRWIHPTLDCLAALDERGELPDPAAVESVTVETFEEAARLDGLPDSSFSGEFSLPFAVAALLAGHEPGLAWFAEAGPDAEPVRSLMECVEPVAEPERSRRYDERGEMTASVTVEAADGSTVEAACADPLGTATNPMSEADLERKFEALASAALDPDRARLLMERILAMESAASIRDVLDPLSPDH